jgi:hypothetical protein
VKFLSNIYDSIFAKKIKFLMEKCSRYVQCALVGRNETFLWKKRNKKINLLRAGANVIKLTQ